MVQTVKLKDIDIAYQMEGAGPPVLLLHGFPQTQAMWDHIAPALAQTRTVVRADLRGYGESSKPKDASAYSFREMAGDQLNLMRHLGFDRFDLIGHDRGGRTAHRMALDAPEAVASLTVMDIVPTHHLLAPLDRKVAQSYYHWFFLAQPYPFPEQMIAADPDRYFESCLLGWGAARLEDFDPDQLTAYRRAWRQPDTIRGMCNDYRAALELDFDHDAADLSQKVTCPTLVLYGGDGAMDKAFDMKAVWTPRCTSLTAQAIPGGHFFPDTAPLETVAALKGFLDQIER